MLPRRQDFQRKRRRGPLGGWAAARARRRRPLRRQLRWLEGAGHPVRTIGARWHAYPASSSLTTSQGARHGLLLRALPYEPLTGSGLLRPRPAIVPRGSTAVMALPDRGMLVRPQTEFAPSRAFLRKPRSLLLYPGDAEPFNDLVATSSLNGTVQYWSYKSRRCVVRDLSRVCVAHLTVPHRNERLRARRLQLARRASAGVPPSQMARGHVLGRRRCGLGAVLPHVSEPAAANVAIVPAPREPGCATAGGPQAGVGARCGPAPSADTDGGAPVRPSRSSRRFSPALDDRPTTSSSSCST